MINYLAMTFNIKDPLKKKSNGQKHMEKCSTSLVNSEKQIKIPMKYHYWLKWVKWYIEIISNAGKDVE